jgi:hypothetical protein
MTNPELSNITKINAAQHLLRETRAVVPIQEPEGGTSISMQPYNTGGITSSDRVSSIGMPMEPPRYYGAPIASGNIYSGAGAIKSRTLNEDRYELTLVKQERAKLDDEMHRLHRLFSININTRDEGVDLANYYNADGYNHNMKILLEKYFKEKRQKNSKYVSKIIDDLAKDRIHMLFKTFIKHNYKKMFDKELNIDMTKIESRDNSSKIVFSIQTRSYNIEITFITNYNLDEIYDRDLHSSRNKLTTFDTKIYVNLKETCAYSQTIDYAGNNRNELERQADPVRSLARTTSFVEPALNSEISNVRIETIEVEKIISIFKANKFYFEDIIRMYLNNNELKTLLYLFKDTLYLLKESGVRVAQEINFYANAIRNLAKILTVNGDLS